MEGTSVPFIYLLSFGVFYAYVFDCRRNDVIPGARGISLRRVQVR